MGACLRDQFSLSPGDTSRIFLEVIYRRTSSANVKALALLADLATVTFNATLAVLTIQLAFASDRRMTSIDLPKSLVYGAVFIALLASTAVAVRCVVRRAGQDPEDIRREIGDAATGDEAV